MYQATTRHVRISVRPSYQEDHSVAEERKFVWSYQIVIENMGQETVQLLSRFWKITDAHGEIQEVRGPGVVGEQPRLEPGDSFEYMSGTPLSTPSGIMQGHYVFENERSERFQVAVPTFSLDNPHEKVRLN